MILAVTLPNPTTRRKRDTASLVGLLVCISSVVWSGLAAFKYNFGEIPFMNNDAHVRVTLEHANYRRLQESYSQGDRDGIPAIRTHQRLSYEQQYAQAGGSQGGSIGQDTSFQGWTRSWQTPNEQASSAEYTELVSPLQGESQLLSSQQQHLGSGRPTQPQLFPPEISSQERLAPTQFRSAGSHQLQETFQNTRIRSEAVDQWPQSSGVLPHQKIARQLPPSELQMQSDQGEPERPIMYTYYEKAVTDMTDEADASLLENWRKAWFDAGWEPTVINESDARSLPEFDALVELVVDPKHIGTYNMACYIRWIAMAAVGGGFMSDYDTFPLNHFLRHGRKLPFDGELTVWAGHVPALVSGSASEYFRVAKQIGYSIQKHALEQKHINLHGPKEAFRNHLPWSDMMALAEIYKTSEDMYIKRYDVVNGIEALQVEEWTSAHCSITDGMRAVHFSHKAMDMGKQAYRGAVHRGTVARQFLNAWHKVCDYTPVADDQPNT